MKAGVALTTMTQIAYRIHYMSSDVEIVEERLRAFDQPLFVGEEFAGIDGLCRIVRIEEGSASNDVAHAWLEPPADECP